MKSNHKPLICLLLWSAWSVVASAQEKPADAPLPAPKPNAQSEAGEPRATTSPAPAPVPSAGRPVARGAGPVSHNVPPGAPPSAVRGAAAATGQKASNADRLELNTATVTGDREQPKVMYIVPWKRADMGDLSGKPMNSLLDEALAPVDRDEFKREVAYFEAVKANADQKGEK